MPSPPISTDIDFLLYGTHEDPSESRRLSVGPWTLDIQNGNLRSVKADGHEVVRAIAFLVRDRDWGTCTADLSEFAVAETVDTIRISYNARYTAPTGAHLDCQMRIELDALGTLTFAADYLADEDFETARAGFTVLHPIIGVAGHPVTVEHGDGTTEPANWPDLIEPWQPFMDIRAITHRVADGLSAETRFAGDVFEMEDQRNWTDGSYKTYVRPLALPWPYMVEKGKQQQQSVTLRLLRDGTAAIAASTNDGHIVIRIEQTEGVIPELGVGLRPEDFHAEMTSLVTLAATGARHLICHFDPTAGHGLEALLGYANIAAQSRLNITLECALPCRRPVDEELTGIAALVKSAGLLLDTLFVSPSVDRQSTPPGSQWPECPPLEDIYSAARAAFPAIRLGGGMLSYFTELNRKRVPGGLIDYVSHCTNPIVHAADDLSVMQTFEALGNVVQSTRAIYGQKPYRIGPSTIAMRQNPYGSATKDNPSCTRTRMPMANTDPRHNGLFAAAWSIAYMATVQEADLEVLTLSTLAGPFGLVAGDNEPIKAGLPRPLWHAISGIGSLSGQKRLRVTSSDPGSILGFGSVDENGNVTIWLANITPRKQTVHIADFVTSRTAILDADAMLLNPSQMQIAEPANALVLQPYAIARLSS